MAVNCSLARAVTLSRTSFVSHVFEIYPLFPSHRKKQKLWILLNVVIIGYCNECVWMCCCSAVCVGALLTYQRKARNIKQTLLSNFSKWYTDHFVRGQN